ncbi:MAG: peptidase S41 [Flavobacteriales bacterium]|nr:MAG: peptidase S41 [Flavobacteriales bacterium]
MKSKILIAGIFCSFAFSFTANAQTTLTDMARKLEKLIGYTDRYYVDSTDQHKLVESAIRSYLNELDPHSVYISKDELKEMNEPLVGNFEGIGIQFNILHDTIMVVSPISGGPSEKLGVQPGDKIVEIEDEKMTGISVKNKDVIDRLRGKKGTQVTISIFRRGEKKLIEYTITRDKIPIFSVDATYMVSPEIGYIKLNRFSATTMREFHKGIDSLRSEGMQHLILDLRGNSGGYLQTAIDLADEFLSSKKVIVYTEGRSFPKNERLATMSGRFETGKLAVLIDNGSASASEIVAGAVQDWDRGLIIGRRSFGKGLVQKPYTLPDGSQIRLTIQRYYTPTGRCIQKPYEEYKNEYQKRLDRGEFFSKDSIDFPDSIKYHTKNNDRIVYGGGGIVPDIFVPIDTTANSTYYRDILRKGLIYQFTLDYVDKNRKILSEQYSNFQSFKENFEITDKFLNEFIDFSAKKGIEKNENELNKSIKPVKTLLKANIARNLWKTPAYWEIWNGINPTYQKALEVLQDDTFEKMELSYK